MNVGKNISLSQYLLEKVARKHIEIVSCNFWIEKRPFLPLRYIQSTMLLLPFLPWFVSNKVKSQFHYFSHELHISAGFWTSNISHLLIWKSIKYLSGSVVYDTKGKMNRIVPVQDSFYNRSWRLSNYVSTLL